MIKERYYDIVKFPIVTEKSTILSEQNKFIFRVCNSANKKEIKESITNIFKVDVVNVNIISIKGKVKRFKGRLGKRNDIKKAVVTLKQGQSIEMQAEV